MHATDSAANARPAYDFASYRRALGSYATGVAILTTVAPTGEHVGVTINSFTSVSLEPPLVSVCLGKFLANFEILNGAMAFNINVLREDQSAISAQFARFGAKKWRDVQFKAARNGARIVEPNLALLECVRYGSYCAGDHNILLGRVEGFSHSSGVAPLLYFRGKYRALRESGNLR